jgi:hypothetical protein
VSRRAAVAAAAVLVVAVAVGAVLVRGAVLGARLGARLAELRAAGYPVSIEDVVERRTADASAVIAASDLLFALESLEDRGREGVELLLGSARLGARHSEAMREALVAHMEALSPQISAVRGCIEGVDGFPLEPEEPACWVVVPHVGPLRSGAQALAARGMVRAETGDAGAAAEDLAAALELADSIGEEPVLIEHHVMAAMDAIAVDATEQTLSLTTLDPGTLGHLRALLGRPPPSPAAALLTGRALAFSTFPTLKASDFRDVVRELPAGAGARLAVPGRRAEEALLFDDLTEESLEACLPDPGERRSAAERLDGRFSAAVARKPTYLMAAWLAGYDAAHLRATVEHEACLRVAATALAVEQWRAGQGAWPESLEQLVPELLPEVPEDPYADGKLLCRRTDDGVVVYSAGPDGRDDGGLRRKDVTGSGERSDAGWDLPFRLIDPERRGAVTLGFREEAMESGADISVLEGLGFSEERLRDLGLDSEDLESLRGSGRAWP